MRLLLLISCISAVLFKECWASDDQLLVSVEQGQLRGSYMKAQNGRQIAAFRGIPYAEPPVDQLRFQDPVPASNWDGVFDASREGTKCIQYDSLLRAMVGKEDCLVLNVYTEDVKPETLKPVMVFIHGGAFMFGSGNGETDIYGPKLWMDRDIILVTFNYRLGPFGFLSTDDVDAPGNFGLLDQTLALKWVRQNIGSFGGDPDSITIFGESAGGASVEYHVLSPRSQGLFHRAISQSGSTMGYWSLFDGIAKYTQIMAELLQCPSDSSKEILECMRTKSALEIVEKRRKLQVSESLMSPIIFGPRIDKERDSPFLPAHPKTMITSKNFNSVPYITGLNKNEGCLLVMPLLAGGGKLMKRLEKDPMELMPYLLGVFSAENKTEILKEVMALFDSEKPLSKQLKTLEEAFSDTMMFRCIDESANLFRKFNENPTYYYHYAHRGGLGLPSLLGITKDLGVCHGDELFQLFANRLLPGPVNEDDKKVSKMLIDLWTSFAIDGTPRSDLAPEWVAMDKDERRYLNIDAKNPVMTSEDLPFHSRLPFWDRILGPIQGEEGEEFKKDEL